VAKLPYIELANGLKIPILHEDRNVIAIDKPQGWMLAPVSWQNTGRNLFAALTSSVSAGDFWAKSRNLKFIRFVHRLDADTSGVLLLVKAAGAMPAYTELFEDRKVQKAYLAVVRGVPEVVEWKCRLRIAPTAERSGVMEINNAQGKDSETLFRVIDKKADRALVMCWPLTGRTHQIRLHLAAVGHPVLGDELYGGVAEGKQSTKLALRSIKLAYKDPFLAEMVYVVADAAAFVKGHGFDPANQALKNTTAPDKALEHSKARLDETRRAEKEAKKVQREAQRDKEQAGAARPAESHRPSPPADRGEWRDRDRPRRARSEGPYQRRFEDRAPQRDSRHGDRPRRPFGDSESRGGPRKFDRGAKPFGRKPFGEQRSGGGDRERAYGDRPQRRSGFERKPFGPRKGFEQGEERRSFGPRREFVRGDRRGRPEGARGERLQTRPGVFQSSAKSGLQAGYKASGFSSRPERRPFRSSTSGGRPHGNFSGSRGPKGKFSGGRKPARGFGRSPRG